MAITLFVLNYNRKGYPELDIEYLMSQKEKLIDLLIYLIEFYGVQS